ncbi:MAG: hypothetical protein CVU48_05255 [Candidatus Cloacimonetes bacterium HGW-Cloacimonetes-1]|nr:MAG: hypothetical protein CVU48_05255 [Candidatus Cloacimonetes bacterium HGW-Cloacimonetes-1]
MLLTFLSLCWVAGLTAINQDAGTTGFNSLKLVYSAHANAMGQAMTGVVTNVDGMQFNPASIIRLPQRAVSSTYMNYFLDTQGGSVQLLMPKDKYSAYGVFINYLNFGSIDRTEVDQNGNLIETGETFGAQNIIIGASLAKLANPAIDLGGTVKMVYDKIDDSSAAAVMIDAGIIHHPMNEKVKVGLSMKNFGRQITYYTGDKYKERLPLTFTAGFSYQIRNDILTALDISKATGQNFVGKFGVDYTLNPYLQLRAGYKTNAGDWRTGGTWENASGISAGLGWIWKSYNIDYALSSYGDLGFVNQVSLKHNF